MFTWIASNSEFLALVVLMVFLCLYTLYGQYKSQQALIKGQDQLQADLNSLLEQAHKENLGKHSANDK